MLLDLTLNLFDSLRNGDYIIIIIHCPYNLREDELAYQ